MKYRTGRNGPRWVQFVVATVLLILGSANANASAIYHWVCDSADCNGDPAFASTIEVSDAAFAAGDLTGVTGNVLAWDTVSGVGDGFSVGLDDLLTGPAGSNTDDDDNLRITLSADRLEIAFLEDLSDGTNITFDDALEGRVDFFEGVDYSVGSLRDGPTGGEFSDILIEGRFVRAVPEPLSLLLMGTGLAAIGFMRRKRG